MLLEEGGPSPTRVYLVLSTGVLEDGQPAGVFCHNWVDTPPMAAERGKNSGSQSSLPGNKLPGFDGKKPGSGR
ncbi:hypothetical protein SBA3_1600008 [Candidatus Sulfopaludibacter sp. SbA3]|nr:hypothetical protein SBA3_1600008 [Candidatus Sulfopaludibacter sp. SbA3]